ncbi:MAG: hypothetical protein PHW14_04075 [Candidatus Omnitrophica bacterium]|nr:hypothetical protein [Candidatus Omnitrophota bacterium]
MDVMNLDRLPENAAKRVKPYLEKLIGVYGDKLVSVFAYGSVTGEGYDPRNSDINLAVVLEEAYLPALKPVLSVVREGFKAGITAPLFLTPTYIKMSLDVFPIEFDGMRDTRLVLYGKDALADISLNGEDIRRECEYQIKGRMVTLRQAYLEKAAGRRELEGLIKKGVKSLMPVFRALVKLKEGVPEMANDEVLKKLSCGYGVDTSALGSVLRDAKKDGKILGVEAEDFLSNLLSCLERLSEAVDRH